MENKLTQKEIAQIADILGQVAVSEAEKGNTKAEKRIFDLIEKLEALDVDIC